MVGTTVGKSTLVATSTTVSVIPTGTKRSPDTSDRDFASYVKSFGVVDSGSGRVSNHSYGRKDRRTRASTSLRVA